MADLLHDLVATQAQQHAERTAVVLGGDRLTYGELDRMSNQLARCLRDAGCERGDRIALLMPKSTAAIAALVGIYKAGCVYVPLDPAGPQSRLTTILDACECRLVLTGGTSPILSAPMLSVTRDRLAAYAGDPIESGAVADDPAHILFTSGSTGVPKGVVITHANVMRFIDWAVPYFRMTADDRVSGHPPLHFDLSFFDIFGAFAAGAELHLVPAELSVLPNKIADLIRQSALTQWFSVPSVLNYMARLDVVRPNDFPALKRVLWCGEVLPTASLMYWMQRLPHVEFTNLYGPTETTIASSFYTVAAVPRDPQQPVPIGAACAGEELLVLDEALHPVPTGHIGNLHIGGVGLSPGYWRDQARTDAVFLADPKREGRRIYKTGDLARFGEDGLVYFIGRADSQIKSRGYRIELGEIEAALNAVSGLREGAIVAIPTAGFESTAICCAYVPTPGTDVTPTKLRRELSARLPAYMLPAKWLAFEQFPKNANGKIDRPRLREVFENHAARAD
jgi:amino acid adenylation domain-containing protein